MAETLQARVPTDSIVAQALIIIEDAKRFVQTCVDQGIPPPDLKLPEHVTKVWIHRWRKSNSLTPKCITCSYTVSFMKKLIRLGVTWRNAARLLSVHELLFGPGFLTFMYIDEKPYRFNAAGGDKVWSRRGQRSAKCKEKRVALLERRDGTTAVFSKRYGESASDEKWQPKWQPYLRQLTVVAAILFLQTSLLRSCLPRMVPLTLRPGSSISNSPCRWLTTRRML